MRRPLRRGRGRLTVAAALQALLDAIAGVSVACAGDVMLDRFVAGTVERISPEAPVPVLKVAHREMMLGGAGNVVRNLVALGARTAFAGIVGEDAEGGEIAALLADLEPVRAELIVASGRPTTVKTRFVAGDQQLLRTDREVAAPVDPATADRLVAAVEAGLSGCRLLILSDYAKGALACGVTERLITLAEAAEVPVVVDPKGSDWRRYRGARLVTPNRREFAVALGRVPAVGEEEAAARALLADAGVAAILLTLGGDGMLLVPASGPAVRLPTEARQVFDVAGAGDTVVAVVAAGLAAGADAEDAARLANAAAGVVVGKVGTAVAETAEIARALVRQDAARLEDKVMPLTSALTEAGRWRRQGLRIGFTNGCFDLLHPGHVALLASARAACDRLVVGLNADASVARLKGPGRPVQPEAARALVLAALAGVDAVVVFAEDTPLPLIEALRPDVLVKGADYRKEDVIGAPFVESYGGRVLLAPIVGGYSTSATLARLGS